MHFFQGVVNRIISYGKDIQESCCLPILENETENPPYDQRYKDRPPAGIIS
jgi:hypothetical protein